MKAHIHSADKNQANTTYVLCKPMGISHFTISAGPKFLFSKWLKLSELCWQDYSCSTAHRGMSRFSPAHCSESHKRLSLKISRQMWPTILATSNYPYKSVSFSHWALLQWGRGFTSWLGRVEGAPKRVGTAFLDLFVSHDNSFAT